MDAHMNLHVLSIRLCLLCLASLVCVESGLCGQSGHSVCLFVFESVGRSVRLYVRMYARAEGSMHVCRSAYPHVYIYMVPPPSVIYRVRGFFGAH